jgi:hypothetical protein
VIETAMPSGWIAVPQLLRAAIAELRSTFVPPPQTAGQIGSCPGASPNQTRNLRAFGRQPTRLCRATCSRA